MVVCGELSLVLYCWLESVVGCFERRRLLDGQRTGPVENTFVTLITASTLAS